MIIQPNPYLNGGAATSSASPKPFPERCPRCTGPLRTGGFEPALSRFDNTTKVCASCGTDEATFQQMYGHVPDFRFTLICGNAQEKGGL